MKLILLTFLCFLVYSEAASYNVGCFAEISLSFYRRFCEVDCAKLREEMLPFDINVTTYIAGRQGNLTAMFLAAANYPGMNMIIGSNTVYYNTMVQLAPSFPNMKWVMSRVPTRFINQTRIPPNIISLLYYEHIIWFLKGALAAKVSDSSQFVIAIPRFEGIFVVPTNFYYAGLKYVNPDAHLTAVLDASFTERAVDLVSYSIANIPYWKVMASFSSWTYLPGNLSANTKFEIGNLISVNTEQPDLDLMLTDTTLTTTTYNVVPLLRETILLAMGGADLTRYFTIRSASIAEEPEPLVDLVHFSSNVPPNTQTFINKLKTKFLDSIDETTKLPKIMCKDFIVDIMKQIHPVPNDCLDHIQQIEGLLLHPDIPVLTLP